MDKFKSLSVFSIAKHLVGQISGQPPKFSSDWIIIILVEIGFNKIMLPIIPDACLDFLSKKCQVDLS